MYLRTILTVLSAAAFSAAAYAAGPCGTASPLLCSTPAVSAPIKAQAPVGILARALAEKKDKLGTENPETLATANALAMMYKANGQFKEAEELYLGSLDTCQRVLGTSHPLTLGTARALASLYSATGRSGEAAQLYERAGIVDAARLNY